MDVWQWVLVYAAFLALVQLLIYYYLRRGRDRQSVALSGSVDPSQHNGAIPGQSPYHDSPGGAEEGDGLYRQAETDRDHAVDAESEDALVCPHCGTRNERESIYTFCRSCASQLGT
jgi:hypothetical protein